MTFSSAAKVGNSFRGTSEAGPRRMATKQTRRRVRLGLCAVLLLCVLALAGALRSARDPVTTAVPTPVLPQPGSAVADAGETTRAVVRAAHAAAAPASRDPGVTATDDGRGALRHYKALTRYPASTRRITEDSFDLLNPNARHERRRILPSREDNPDLEWEVRFTADRYFVRGGEPVLISLELWRRDQPVQPRDVVMIAETRDARGLARSAAVEVEHDGRATSALFVPDDHWPDLVGQIRITATFSAEDLRNQTGHIDLYFTGEKRLPARFTGAFREGVLEGDLVIELGVEVRTAGTYHVEGNLYDADGAPFGWARYEGPMMPATTAVPLRFYGLLFHDASARAPFVLRQVRGRRVRPGDVPHREDMPDLEADIVTGAHYRLAEFRSEENDTPKRRKMIDLYEDAIERGVRLTDPQYADLGND